jgi:histidyl-tRNA synthetase
MSPLPPVFIAYLGPVARQAAVRLLVQVRQAGLGAQMAMGGSLKAQLRQADKRGARFVLILGEDELARGEVTLRDLAAGTQVAVALAAVVEQLQQRLA